MQVQLFKKLSNYKDKDGKERTATNFMIKCGDYYIPIEVKYFAGKDDEYDPNFRARKMVLSAFADALVDNMQSRNEQDPRLLSSEDQENVDPLPF